MTTTPSPLETPLKLLDAWLKLRAAMEQRAYWYYALLLVLFGAVVGGADTLQALGGAGFWLLVGVGAGGLFGALGIIYRERSDTKKLNALQTAGTGHTGVLDTEWTTSNCTSWLMLFAGVVFFALMVGVAWQIRSRAQPARAASVECRDMVEVRVLSGPLVGATGCVASALLSHVTRP